MFTDDSFEKKGFDAENRPPSYMDDSDDKGSLRVWAKDMEKDHLGYFVSKNKDDWETWKGLCGITTDKGVSRGFDISKYDGSFGRRCRKCLTAYKKMGAETFNADTVGNPSPSGPSSYTDDSFEKKGFDAKSFASDEYRLCEICESTHHESEFGNSDDEEQTMTPKGEVCDGCFGDILFDDFQNADDRDWAKQYLESKGFKPHTIEGSFEDTFVNAESFGAEMITCDECRKEIGTQEEVMEDEVDSYKVERTGGVAVLCYTCYQEAPIDSFNEDFDAETFGAEEMCQMCGEKADGMIDEKFTICHDCDTSFGSFERSKGFKKFGAKGIDTFAEPLEDIGISKPYARLGVIAAGITALAFGVNKIRK